MEPRFCMQCNDVIHGRSDKKFCDDNCRTMFNNKFKVASETVKEINSILRKNRRILEELIPEEGKIKINTKRLFDKGFNFSYFTHAYNPTSGSVFYFIYEYGYQKLEDDYYLLIKRQSIDD